MLIQSPPEQRRQSVARYDWYGQHLTQLPKSHAHEENAFQPH